MSTRDLRFEIAETVSDPAREKMRQMLEMLRQYQQAAVPLPSTDEEWEEQRKARNDIAEFFQKPYLDAVGPDIREIEVGGTTGFAVSVETSEPQPGLIVYLHGGAFTYYSAKSSLKAAVMMAKASGRKVVSLDYPLAPQADFMEVTEVTSRAVHALSQEMPPEKIALFGTSAGGSIAAASTLRLRDEGHAMPGALVLHSPGSDCRWMGDSFLTMGDRDPAMDEDEVRRRVELYASETDRDHPYASPALGDFSKGFPPTLIQCGTREFLLSDSVRLYRAIRDAGNDAVLDLYEGMIHVFATMFDGTPESDTAFDVSRAFLDKALGAARTV